MICYNHCVLFISIYVEHGEWDGQVNTERTPLDITPSRSTETSSGKLEMSHPSVDNDETKHKNVWFYL